MEQYMPVSLWNIMCPFCIRFRKNSAKTMAYSVIQSTPPNMGVGKWILLQSSLNCLECNMIGASNNDVYEICHINVQVGHWVKMTQPCPAEKKKLFLKFCHINMQVEH